MIGSVFLQHTDRRAAVCLCRVLLQRVRALV
jgi:hypothetical protein